MKMRNLLSISILLLGMLPGINPASAEQKRTFGFFGEVDSFDRSKQLLVIDDHVFSISNSASVHKKKGHKATLSDIRPGVKVGFYPQTSNDGGREASISAIWILPANWKAERGYADD